MEVISLSGYRNMLFDWSRRTRISDQLKILRRALQDAGLGHVAATILPAGVISYHTTTLYGVAQKERNTYDQIF